MKIANYISNLQQSYYEITHLNSELPEFTNYFDQLFIVVLA